MKPLARILWLFRWVLGIGALAGAYGLFELPGLLIALFVGAVIVTASRRKKSPLALIKIDGVQIDFRAMKMTEGTDEFALRRTEGGKWERSAMSADAWEEAVSKRMVGCLSEAENLASVETATRLWTKIAGENPHARIPVRELDKARRSLPRGSEGRRLLGEIITKNLRDVLGDEKADEEAQAVRRIELWESVKEWAEDNGGFEPLRMRVAPIETAYQRYIRQG
jgi:hypothetical protein